MPLHDLRILRGTYEEVMSKEFYRNLDTQDYVKIILTDEEDIPDGMQRLRNVYPRLMRLEYDNSRPRERRIEEGAAAVEHSQPLELFEEFYEMQNNQTMNAAQKEYIRCLLDKLQEG